MTVKGGLAYERILNAAKEPHNWLTYFGDYRGQHYLLLKQINTSNAGGSRRGSSSRRATALYRLPLWW